MPIDASVVRDRLRRGAASILEVRARLWSGSSDWTTPSVRSLIRRLGIAVTLITVVLPPLGYATLDYLQLRKRAAEEASVGAAQIELHLLMNGSSGLNRVSTNVLQGIRRGDSSVSAAWLVDDTGTTVTFSGERIWWPEIRAIRPVKTDSFRGAFAVAMSTRDAWIGGLWMGFIFLVMGAGVHWCFMRLPLAALDAAARSLADNERELRRRKDELRKQNARLDAALGNMMQGLAMFDADQSLVLCNDRYREIYGFSAETAKPGTTLTELIEHRVRNGVPSSGSTPELVDLMLRHHTERSGRQFLNQLGDGRCIAVTAQRMPDGGTVTTHQDITEQRCAEAKITHMALHDALTGLPNRVMLGERLGHGLARTKRGEMLAVHLLDLDRFKVVNDTLGHPVGDKLLKAVTARLQQVAREVDTVARMGGDEFAIVQVPIASPSDATAFAIRVIKEVRRPYDIDGHHIVIGTSIGIAVGPADGEEPDTILRNADLALYRAKASGRGTLHFFEPEMDAQMRQRQRLETDLRSALARQEFELHYQPQIDLRNQKLTGFEALLRWRHPEKGLLLPGLFIPFAEEIGEIVPIGSWVLDEACTTAAGWPNKLAVSVNLSPVQFGSPGLVDRVAAALGAAELDPQRLELEITESTLLQDTESTLATLYELRALGVRVALDDFGTGYSSLSYLQSFPFDKIKIDRSFVADITAGVGSINIVRAVTAMAQGLGMTTTAEGVETPEQLEIVRAEGCTEMQGFLSGKPIPASELWYTYMRETPQKKSGTTQAA